MLRKIITFLFHKSFSKALNKIENSNHNLDQEQIKLIFDKTKLLPNETELSIGIIKAGKVEFIGLKRENNEIKLIENHKKAFEIGSITKIFTATLLANFVIEEKIKLEDDIQSHLNIQMNSKERITFQNLINHTSGLPRLPSNYSIWSVDPNNPYKNYDKESLFEYLTSDIKLNNKPGLNYEYSNLGAGLLGFTLGLISNSTYETLLQEKIFNRYKMTNSVVNREKLKIEIVPGLKQNGKVASNWDFDVLAGAGAILSTTEDLVKFALSHFDDRNMELDLTRNSTFKINDKMKIGLGWHILKEKNNTEFLWHNGGTGGYSSSITMDLVSRNGIVVLSNVAPLNKHSENIDQLNFGLLSLLNKD